MAKRPKEAVQKDVQGFMRSLLEDPQLAILFLKSPKEVARRFSIAISAKDAQKIKKALETIKSGIFPGTVAEDCSWHDFPECDHIARAANPAEDLIRPNMAKITKKPTKKIVAEDCSWHDFPECDHIARAINPADLVSKPQRGRSKQPK